ncbi:hypothetical protein HPT25_05550 [Bacillus sp. BRMEA1]|uniref:hypothetical protein n=1 Tax=Neobacillus endophyticus TaxID=2738405 RepID=UPI001565C524|nr:hypothetical protein [Neobacillus endophyticus]NRD76958.1 hypothetical protein [Neobacillus endophyticus]
MRAFRRVFRLELRYILPVLDDVDLIFICLTYYYKFLIAAKDYKPFRGIHYNHGLLETKTYLLYAFSCRRFHLFVLNLSKVDEI